MPAESFGGGNVTKAGGGGGREEGRGKRERYSVLGEAIEVGGGGVALRVRVGVWSLGGGGKEGWICGVFFFCCSRSEQMVGWPIRYSIIITIFLSIQSSVAGGT